MTVKSINYIALFAGAFLLMSRSSHQLYLWSRFETRARSRSEKNSGIPARSRRETAVAPISDTAGGKAAPATDASTKASAGIYAATLTPYGCGGHYFFGGHYG
jgi:hypothetical protein